MTGYADRIHVGLDHEQGVTARLDAEEWTVQPWGQGLLTDEIRQALVGARVPILWRWIPDLIAVRGKDIRLVDPKSELRRDTPFFALETSAWAAHHAMRVLGLPVIYVWSDMTVNWPSGIKPVMFQDGTGASGSRTPFVLVRKADQYDWAKAFPPREEPA